ncbi:MAG TPA: sodium:solute symporter family protein [archaeon]|nr:sodium:solute symporter family protein [archaeon]
MLNTSDWLYVIAFFILSLAVGLGVARRAGSNISEFFLSGRHMPWWLLGFSMVATTFATDTPNLVTDLVRTHGVSGNWLWWSFLLTGMLTVFVYARLWRRSGVLTDLEFYELRYSGKAAAFLRGFRALYLGAFFNIIIMAAVTLAAIKFSGVLFGLSPVKTVMIAASITVVYSAIGGLSGVLITDLFQFIIAMTGSVATAWYVLGLPQVKGLNNLLSHSALRGSLSLLPDFSDTNTLFAVFIIPLAVQWWSVWYPGSEPGGGGYIAQRMLAAKTENHAVWATLLFNVAHYALRPWPWIIVALCSLVIFPDLASLRRAFPLLDPALVRNDLGYPAMLTFLPHGLLGLVVASLFAAYMSTISTHLNWGSSYLVNDFYKRFVRPDSSEKQLVLVGRICTILLMVAAGFLALLLSHSLQAFNIMLQIGAGTGLLFLLRWFWWRINAVSEISAMLISFLVAVYFEFIHQRLGFELLAEWQKLTVGVGVTTIGWIIATFFTKPTDRETLLEFCRLVHPGGPGWQAVWKNAHSGDIAGERSEKRWDVPGGIMCMFLGCVAVYSILFATGYWIYSNYIPAVILTCLAVVSSWYLLLAWRRIISQTRGA